MHVALVYPHRDPVSPSAWSGTPAGLAAGLKAVGSDVLPVAAVPGKLARLLIAAARRTSWSSSTSFVRAGVFADARASRCESEIRRNRPIDLVIAMGTDVYPLAPLADSGVVIGTYDDSTLAQMWKHPESHIRNASFSRASVQRWSDRQASSLRAADVCFASTDWAKDSLIGDCGVDPSRAHAVGIGHFTKGAPQEPRDWSSPRFLFVGVDWRRKNGDAVLKAFQEVRHRFPEASLDVVGNHPRIDAPSVRGHGLLRLDDPKEQKKLDHLYSQATVFVLPSRFEPAGISYLEAASAGLAVIATTEGGASSLMGTGALAINPDSNDELVGAMLRLADGANARGVAENAAAVARRNTWEAVAERILALGRDTRSLNLRSVA